MTVRTKLEMIENLEDVGERLAALRELDELTPDDPDVLLELGKALLRSGDLEAAEKTLRRSRSVDDDGFASLYLGNLAWRKGELDAADEAFARAEARMPADPCPVWCRADIAWARGRTREAERLYRLAVERQPNEAVANAKLGQFFVRVGRTTDGESWIRKALVIDPECETAIRLMQDVRRPRDE